jgi:2Fe-2S ferredoxin
VETSWAARLKPRSEAEQVMVEDTGHFLPTSRLACQVDYEDSLDGLQLTLAPEF